MSVSRRRWDGHLQGDRRHDLVSEGGILVSAAVIAASKPQFDLARAWSMPAGFELDPVEVPALEMLL